MKLRTLALLLATIPSLHAQQPTKGAPMQHATGSFEPDIKPVPADFPTALNLGRMTMHKQFHGDIEGTSIGQMLTSMSATKGSAGYVAVELVTGTLDGHSGTFSLIHLGLMDRGKPTLTCTVVPDSGTGDLLGLTGTLTIHVAPDGKHTYGFDYALPTRP